MIYSDQILLKGGRGDRTAFERYMSDLVSEPLWSPTNLAGRRIPVKAAKEAKGCFEDEFGSPGCYRHGVRDQILYVGRTTKKLWTRLRGRYFIGASVTGMEFTSLNGVPLRDLTLNFKHEDRLSPDTLGTPEFENDYIALDLAVSLIATPPVLFLDEPTTGLDPRSRVELWAVLLGLVSDGTTLLLTTQYLEEADQLADRIAVIDRGHVIAEGTPLELKDQSGKAALVVTVSHAGDLGEAERLLRSMVDEVHVDPNARQLTAPANGLGDVTRIAGAFDGSGIELDDLGLKRPSLDDVFLHLTGHRAEEVSEPDDDREEVSA